MRFGAVSATSVAHAGASEQITNATAATMVKQTVATVAHPLEAGAGTVLCVPRHS